MKKIILLLAISAFILSCGGGSDYNEAKIGNQIWMGQSLEETKFRNGDEIPIIENAEEWVKYGEEKKPACCYYTNNKGTFTKIYGLLYNWWAVADSRGLAPKGWHIASADEWKKLISSIGGRENEEKINSKATEYGWSVFANNTDDYGFSLMPSGSRIGDGSFKSNLEFCYIWTSTMTDKGPIEVSIYNGISFDTSISDGWKRYGYAVRCIKD